MCGIAGLLRRDHSTASRDDAVRMASSMQHRGPDGMGAFADGPVALGHVRLAIRDRSEAAAQPMVAPGGAGVLVYNGEVYNDAELRADLVRDGVTFRGHGDAEVVMHAVARWGVERASRRFDGMFAFAWWDAREQALWLVRDRFGTKPLHVAIEPGFVAFGSEVRALRALPGVARRPDALVLARRIVPWLSDPLQPPFEGVENVPPGEAWRVTAGGVDRRVFADLLAEVDPARIVAAASESVDAWEARVFEAVEGAVRSHLASDVPVAAFVSGGVDSNLVAAIAKEVRDDLVAYTVDTCDPSSETPVAAAIARHLKVDLRVVRMDADAMLRAWPDAVEREEHPCAHESHVASLLMSRAARADGIVVALTGEGSDEMFGGYDFLRRTREIWRRAENPWTRWVRSRRALRRRLEETPFRYQSIRSEPESHARYQIAMQPVEESRAHALMRQLARIEPAADRAFLAHGMDALRRHLGSILLRHDRMSMAASVEARVPFVSNRVADVGLHLPLAAKLRGRTCKWVLKRVAERWLPRSVVYAKKQGFPVPASQHRGTTALLRGGATSEIFRWTRAAEAELVPRLEAQPLTRFAVVSLELWGRIFLRGERKDDLKERLLAASTS